MMQMESTLTVRIIREPIRRVKAGGRGCAACPEAEFMV